MSITSLTSYFNTASFGDENIYTQNQTELALTLEAAAHELANWKSLISMSAGGGAFEFGKLAARTLVSAVPVFCSVPFLTQAFTFFSGTLADTGLTGILNQAFGNAEEEESFWEKMIDQGSVRGIGFLGMGQSFIVIQLMQGLTSVMSRGMLSGENQKKQNGILPSMIQGLQCYFGSGMFAGLTRGVVSAVEQRIKLKTNNINVGANLVFAQNKGRSQGSPLQNLGKTISNPLEKLIRKPLLANDVNPLPPPKAHESRGTGNNGGNHGDLPDDLPAPKKPTPVPPSVETATPLDPTKSLGDQLGPRTKSPARPAAPRRASSSSNKVVEIMAGPVRNRAMIARLLEAWFKIEGNKERIENNPFRVFTPSLIRITLFLNERGMPSALEVHEADALWEPREAHKISLIVDSEIKIAWRDSLEHLNAQQKKTVEALLVRPEEYGAFTVRSLCGEYFDNNELAVLLARHPHRTDLNFMTESFTFTSVELFMGDIVGILMRIPQVEGKSVIPFRLFYDDEDFEISELRTPRATLLLLEDRGGPFRYLHYTFEVERREGRFIAITSDVRRSGVHHVFNWLNKKIEVAQLKSVPTPSVPELASPKEAPPSIQEAISDYVAATAPAPITDLEISPPARGIRGFLKKWLFFWWN